MTSEDRMIERIKQNQIWIDTNKEIIRDHPEIENFEIVRAAQNEITKRWTENKLLFKILNDTL